MRPTYRKFLGLYQRPVLTTPIPRAHQRRKFLYFGHYTNSDAIIGGAENVEKKKIKMELQRKSDNKDVPKLTDPPMALIEFSRSVYFCVKSRFFIVTIEATRKTSETTRRALP